MQKPSKYKIAFLTWLGIYPPLTALLLLLGDVLSPLSLPLRTLILTGILVPMMVFIIMPMLTKIFRNWLK